MTIHSVVIQKLLSTNAHLGRRVATNHFKIYTYGLRNRMAIIDSDKTLICLRNACDFIGNLARNDAKFLFVNTNTLFDEIIDQMTKRIGVKNDTSWRLSGFLTNSSSPKKFRSRNKKMVLGVINQPDCVVIFDTERKSSVVQEASRLHIPIVGLVDSSMPLEIFKRITYPVPANDSAKFVYLFCNMITKTFLYEQKRRGIKPAKSAEIEVKIGKETVQVLEDGRIPCASDEIFVRSYENLLPASDDPLEIKKILEKLVIVKSDAGIDTKMGFDKPKSIIEVCNGLTCLDLLVNYIESLNSKYGCNIPLLLMNKLDTNDAILKVLENHSDKNIHTLVQVPSYRKIDDDFEPTSSEERNSDSELQVLMSLKSSGKLDDLLSQGKEYVLLLKSNNLAEVVDPKILNYMIQSKIEYCMEVMPMSSSDFKDDASHSLDTKFKLRDIARTQVDDQPRENVRTQDEESDETPKSRDKTRLSDTSNVWMDMNGMLGIVDRAGLDRGESPTLKHFNCAVGVNVPKSRYLPLESTSDLFLFQSDLFDSSEGILSRNKARKDPSLPSIELGPEFAKVGDFKCRFESIPSIIELRSLNVSGDVWFGSNVTLKGLVSITAKPGMKIEIPDGTVLENKMITRQDDL
ncbi:UTP--glucose-1-phosphate uridylyltransferase isoform X1 [Daucus carota subsp. sativus]|uniref:UTP--glucose-1-phosphate uridylyltransferase isoform X1 n=1 Tax=Daucus carota subsp. sativus TaxID=79200 RepID=UPI0007EFEAF6|nr:PREDICTED: UTP--glucose-1-phosphate uridylyltransferase-like isoform X1 [Daucus carota subsp. sativus]